MLSLEDLLIANMQFHVSPVLHLISTLKLFDSVSLKLQHGGYLYDDEMRQILVKTRERIEKELHQKYQEIVTSYNSNYKIGKSHRVRRSYSGPKTCS